MKRTAVDNAPSLRRKVAVDFGDGEVLNATLRAVGPKPGTRSELNAFLAGGLLAISEEAKTAGPDEEPELLARLAAGEASAVRAVQEIVFEWDMEEEDGTPTGLGDEALKAFGLGRLVSLYRILEAELARPLDRSGSAPSKGARKPAAKRQRH